MSLYIPHKSMGLLLIRVVILLISSKRNGSWRWWALWVNCINVGDKTILRLRGQLYSIADVCLRDRSREITPPIWQWAWGCRNTCNQLGLVMIWRHIRVTGWNGSSGAQRLMKSIPIIYSKILNTKYNTAMRRRKWSDQTSTSPKDNTPTGGAMCLLRIWNWPNSNHTLLWLEINLVITFMIKSTVFLSLPWDSAYVLLGYKETVCNGIASFAPSNSIQIRLTLWKSGH